MQAELGMKINADSVLMSLGEIFKIEFHLLGKLLYAKHIPYTSSFFIVLR